MAPPTNNKYTQPRTNAPSSPPPQIQPMRVSAMAKGVFYEIRDLSPTPSPKPKYNYLPIQIIIQTSSAHPKPTNTISLRICGSASTTRQSYCGCQQEEQLRLGNPHSKIADPYRTQQIRERGGGVEPNFQGWRALNDQGWSISCLTTKTKLSS